jgi:hypothetical protein
MLLTNADVQSQLNTAINQIHVDLLNNADALFAHKLTVAVNLLELMKAYSASSNDIPGLRGMGLEQALNFANQYVSCRKDSRMFDFTSLYKALSLSLS